MGELLNATQAAKFLKISRVTLNKVRAAGIITVAATEKSGPKFDPDTLAKEYEGYRAYSELQSRHSDGKSRGGRPAKQAEGTGADADDEITAQLRGTSDAKRLLRAKAIQAALAAQKAGLEIQKMKGELIPITDVRKDAVEFGATVISSLQAFPSRVANQLATMTDSREIADYLNDEINAMVVAIRKRFGFEGEE